MLRDLTGDIREALKGQPTLVFRGVELRTFAHLQYSHAIIVVTIIPKQ